MMDCVSHESQRARHTRELHDAFALFQSKVRLVRMTKSKPTAVVTVGSKTLLIGARHFSRAMDPRAVRGTSSQKSIRVL